LTFESIQTLVVFVKATQQTINKCVSNYSN